MRKAKTSLPEHWLQAAEYEALQANDTDAHRLGTVPGGWAERFGEDILVSHATQQGIRQLRDEAEHWLRHHALPWRRLWVRLLVARGKDQQAPRLVSEEPSLDGKGIAREAGLSFGLDFTAGYSVGLFLDQRANRRALEALAPRRVLNCFAYTCSFSVAAARAEAETVSVDLSKRSLQRGRENFARNDFDVAAGHRFLSDDVFAVLPRLERRGERFDAVILDPPTFSRGAKGKVFRIADDLDHLLELVLAVTAPGGHILVSVNRADITPPILRKRVEAFLTTSQQRATITQGGALPDIPAAAMPSTLWLRLP